MTAPLALAAASTALDLAKTGLGALSRTSGPAQDKAKAAARDFESMFLENALQRLTESSGSEGPLGENGVGGGVYRSLLVKEYAGQIAKGGGVGIAHHIYGEVLRLQEARHAS